MDLGTISHSTFPAPSPVIEPQSNSCATEVKGSGSSAAGNTIDQELDELEEQIGAMEVLTGVESGGAGDETAPGATGGCAEVGGPGVSPADRSAPGGSVDPCAEGNRPVQGETLKSADPCAEGSSPVQGETLKSADSCVEGGGMDRGCPLLQKTIASLNKPAGSALVANVRRAMEGFPTGCERRGECEHFLQQMQREGRAPTAGELFAIQHVLNRGFLMRQVAEEDGSEYSVDISPSTVGGGGEDDWE